MTTYDHIALIFNPKSSGNAKEHAKALQRQITLGSQNKNVQLYPTEKAGHAVDIARDVATTYKHPLIISVSGDGGYNEVVNGAYEAVAQGGASPVVAVYGAGNANDHERVMVNRDLVDLIRNSKPKPLDLLELEAGKLHRVAHSYIGFGLSPKAGHRLNRYGKRIHEAALTLYRTFRTLDPVFMVRDGHIRAYDSIVCANINEMAKYLKLAQDWSPNDGKFELVALEHHNRAHLLAQLLRSSIIGPKEIESLDSLSLTPVKQVHVQLDGEIEKIPAKVPTQIKVLPAALHSLYSD